MHANSFMCRVYTPFSYQLQYYFKVDKVKPSKLKIVWYKSINEKEVSLDTNLSVLHSVVVDISQMLDITM